MYLRPVHSDLDPEVCHAFVKENPLGVLITHLPVSDPSISPLQASHIPFIIAPPLNGFSSLIEGGEGQSKGVLRGHMARANPQTKAILSTASTPAAQSTASSTGTGVMSYLFGSRADPTTSTQSGPSASELPEDVLIIFNCPTHSYVTPTFYTETKPTTHKVVPTWDYAAVQIYGTLRVYDKGSEASDFLQKQVEDLTKMEEARYISKCPQGHGEKEEWEISMAPRSYVDLLKKGIVGIEVDIKRIEGKFKMSQENQQGDWEGVVDGFKAMGTEEGRKMAHMIEQRGVGREVRSKKEEEGLREDGTDHELSRKSKEEA